MVAIDPVPSIPADFAVRVARVMGIDPERIEWKLRWHLSLMPALSVYIEGPTKPSQRQAVFDLMNKPNNSLGLRSRGACLFGFCMSRRYFDFAPHDVVAEGDFRGSRFRDEGSKTGWKIRVAIGR